MKEKKKEKRKKKIMSSLSSVVARRTRAFSNHLSLSPSPAEGVATCTGACTPAPTHPPLAAGHDLCQLWMWPVSTRSTEFSKKIGSSARVRFAAFSNSEDWAKSE